MRACRYLVYVALLGLLIADAWLRNAPLSSLVVYLVVAPACVHGIWRVASPRVACAAHGLEGVLGIVVLSWLGAGLWTVALLAFAVVLSGIALWGVRSLAVLPVAVAFAVAVLMVPVVAAQAPGQVVLESGTSQTLMQAWAAVACLGVLIAINSVVRAHALDLFGRGTRLASEQQRLLRYLPEDVPRHLREGGSGSRRVWYTVAFIDLAGFTRAAEVLPPEALNALLNDFLAAVTELVEEAGGQVTKFLGDGVLCVFSSEGPSERGVVAAACVRGLSELPMWMARLNLRWQSLGYPHDFAVSAGVASGYCTCGEWGRGERLDYTVIGSPVNLASRLQAAARSGSDDGRECGVLIDPVTAQIVSPHLAPGPALEVRLPGSSVRCAYRPLPEETPLC